MKLFLVECDFSILSKSGWQEYHQIQFLYENGAAARPLEQKLALGVFLIRRVVSH